MYRVNRTSHNRNLQYFQFRKAEQKGFSSYGGELDFCFGVGSFPFDGNDFSGAETTVFYAHSDLQILPVSGG